MSIQPPRRQHLWVWFIAPLIPELWIKMVFAVVWASFGVLHLYRIGGISGHVGMTEFNERRNFPLGRTLGALSGATVAAVTRVGQSARTRHEP